MNNRQKKNEDFSSERGNLEIIKHPESGPIVSEDDNAVELARDGLKVKKGGNVIIGTLNLIVRPLKDRHERFYKKSKFHLGADLALASVVIALAVVLAWLNIRTIPLNVYLDFAPENTGLTSGQPREIVIIYGNKNGTEIKEARLKVELPKNFEIIAAEPADLFDKNTRTFALGTIEKGASGGVKISVLPLGQIGGQAKIFAFMDYRLAGAEDRLLSSRTYSFSGSVAGVNIIVPETVYSGMETPLIVEIKNNGAKDLGQLDLEFIDGWEIRSAKGILRDKKFSVDQLPAGSTRKFEFSVYSDRPAGTAEIGANLSIMRGEMSLLQATAARQLEIRSPKFSVSIVSTGENLKNGERANFIINCVNNETAEVNEARLQLSSGNVNFAANIHSADGTQLSGNTVLLGKLTAGEKREVKISADFAQKKIEPDQEVGLSGKVFYLLAERELNYRISSSRLKVVSDFAVRSAAYYYSPQGDQLGVGPLPPVIGEPTSFWIFLQAENAGNQLANFSLVAELPAGVIWTDKKSVSAGDLYHGEIGGRVIWSVGEIAPLDGNYRAGFEVEIVPGEKDLGKNLDLLTDIKFSAHDDFADVDLGMTAGNITTDLPQDRLAHGKGRVLAK